MKAQYFILITLLIILTILNLAYIPEPITAPVYQETNNKSYDYYLVNYQDLTTSGINRLCSSLPNNHKIFKVIINPVAPIKKDYYFKYISCHDLNKQLLLQINDELNKHNFNDDIINIGIKISSITYYGIA